MKIAADRDFESALSGGKHKHVRRHVCAVGKIFKIGKQAFNAQLQAFYKVVTPHEGQFGKVGFAAEVKWLPQIGAQNTLKGDYVWFKIGAQF
jgi:hypothetical protein